MKKAGSAYIIIDSLLSISVLFVAHVCDGIALPRYLFNILFPLIMLAVRAGYNYHILAFSLKGFFGLVIFIIFYIDSKKKKEALFDSKILPYVIIPALFSFFIFVALGQTGEIYYLITKLKRLSVILLMIGFPAGIIAVATKYKKAPVISIEILTIVSFFYNLIIWELPHGFFNDLF
ncbi:MAG: hypothetical protein LBI67_12165 [Treponema sp.]|jgi:hypothetical protein|nr:hypothetical protein [Treponema sp.]